MRIRKVIASSFGCLSGTYSFRDDLANIILEPNERGKSTLVSAILAGLYGFPPSREKITLPEDKARRPWNGSEYRVALEIEDDAGRLLRIDRDFDRGTVKVTDLATNKNVTRQFRAGKKDVAVGERLLGISREVFLKTCLVQQLRIDDMDDTKDLQSKVEAIFDTAGGKATAAGAIRVLEDAVCNYRGTLLKSGRVETEVARLQDAIAKHESQMQQLTHERKKAAPAMNRLRKLREDLAKLELHRQRHEYLSRLAESAEIESELKQHERNRKELDTLLRRRDSLKPFSTFPKDKASDFERVAGQLDVLRKRRKELEDALETLIQNLETASSKLEQHKGLEGLDEEFKTRLHELWTELANLSHEAENKRERLAKFEESLRNDGLDLSEIGDLHRRFSELRVEDNDLLRDSESRIPRIEAEVVKLEVAERSSREERCALRRPARILLPVGGVLVLAGITAMLLSAMVVGVAFLLIGVAVGTAALFLVPRINRNRMQKLLASEAQARDQRESAIGQRNTITEKLEKMARQVGYETVAELAEAFKRWGRLQDRAVRLESFRKDVDSANGNVWSCREKASAEIKPMGLHVPPEQLDLDVLNRAEKTLRDYLELAGSLRQMQERRSDIEHEMRKLDEERDRLQERVRTVLKAANLGEDLPVEKALPKVKEVRKNREEYDRLTSVWIPDKEEKLLAAAMMAEMRSRLRDLHGETEKMSAGCPDLTGLSPSKKHSEYEEEARRIARAIAENTDERARVSREVLHVEDTYRKEYPRLVNELAEWKETLDRTQRFAEAVRIAVDTLKSISTQSHALWASELNPRTNDILRHFTPCSRELLFDPHLSFTVIPAEGARPIEKKEIEAQQSVGAKHQIYLAVRLALTDYLSAAGTALPVILDDPFATSDDDRFLSGMSFLCREFRKNHQLIILTCHRHRHIELFEQKCPGLTDEILLIELSPAR